MNPVTAKTTQIQKKYVVSVKVSPNLQNYRPPLEIFFSHTGAETQIKHLDIITAPKIYDELVNGLMITILIDLDHLTMKGFPQAFCCATGLIFED